MPNLINVYGKCYQAGVAQGDWAAPDAGIRLVGGYKWNNNNWVMVIKFQVPTPAKSVTFGFCNHQSDVLTENRTMRYKITKAEDPSLNNATSDTPGDGTFLVKKNAYARNELTITQGFTTGATYYLYIWTNNSSMQYGVLNIRWYDNSDGNGFYGTYVEVDGFVYIGSESDAYQCYIYNGTEWELYKPYTVM